MPPQEPGIGIKAQSRSGRHVERLLPAGEADAVEIHRVVGLDGGETALLRGDGKHVQRGERRRADERRVRRRRLDGDRLLLLQGPYLDDTVCDGAWNARDLFDGLSQVGGFDQGESGDRQG